MAAHLLAAAAPGFFSHHPAPQAAEKVTALMGLDHVEVWESRSDPKSLSANSSRNWNDARHVAGYDFMLPFNMYRSAYAGTYQTLKIDGADYQLSWGTKPQVVELRKGREAVITLLPEPMAVRVSRTSKGIRQ